MTMLVMRAPDFFTPAFRSIRSSSTTLTPASRSISATKCGVLPPPQIRHHEQAGDDGDATLGDLMANGDGTPEDAVMAMVDSDLLDELLGTLDTRARFAVESRFGLIDGERKSFREVGEQLGVTAEAARRLVSRAVVGLRDDAERILAV